MFYFKRSQQNFNYKRFFEQKRSFWRTTKNWNKDVDNAVRISLTILSAMSWSVYKRHRVTLTIVSKKQNDCKGLYWSRRSLCRTQTSHSIHSITIRRAYTVRAHTKNTTHFFGNWTIKHYEFVRCFLRNPFEKHTKTSTEIVFKRSEISVFTKWKRYWNSSDDIMRNVNALLS